MSDLSEVNVEGCRGYTRVAPSRPEPIIVVRSPKRGKVVGRRGMEREVVKARKVFDLFSVVLCPMSRGRIVIVKQAMKERRRKRKNVIKRGNT
jgi:hypothetical protein